MNENKINKLIEYLSITLILSYFFVHNIILVFIGISFSFYLININLIKSTIMSILKIIAIKNIYFSINKSNKGNESIKINTPQIKIIKKNSKQNLVEIIEESGFIPSLDINDESNVV